MRHVFPPGSLGYQRITGKLRFARATHRGSAEGLSPLNVRPSSRSRIPGGCGHSSLPGSGVSPDPSLCPQDRRCAPGGSKIRLRRSRGQGVKASMNAMLEGRENGCWQAQPALRLDSRLRGNDTKSVSPQGESETRPYPSPQMVCRGAVRLRRMPRVWS